MLFRTPYLYVSTSQTGSFFPQAKNHAMHGKNNAAHGGKTSRHLVKTPGHEI